jgi:hypothetical protein
MAKVRLDPLFSGMSGGMGGLIFRTLKNGEVTVSRRLRKSNTPPSEAQLAQQKRFGEASKYASVALTDPVLRALYEDRAAEEGITAFAAARSDYLQGNDRLATE